MWQARVFVLACNKDTSLLFMLSILCTIQHYELAMYKKCTDYVASQSVCLIH